MFGFGKFPHTDPTPLPNYSEPEEESKASENNMILNNRKDLGLSSASATSFCLMSVEKLLKFS